MKIIIDNGSMVPIYEQIVDSVKKMIHKGTLKEQDILPSVRSLSGELKISALTVKKAYDILEEEGYTKTVHGKGSYILPVNSQKNFQDALMEVERQMEDIVIKGEKLGISHGEIREILDIIISSRKE